MDEHSKTAWEIVTPYRDLLASETRDLAAAIDHKMGYLREAVDLGLACLDGNPDPEHVAYVTQVMRVALALTK